MITCNRNSFINIQLFITISNFSYLEAILKISKDTEKQILADKDQLSVHQICKEIQSSTH